MRSPKLALVSIAVALLAMGAAIWSAYQAPQDVTEGIVQKIMYVHVPAALTTYLAFFVAFLASIGFLVTKKRAWDRVGVSAVELGVLFCTLVLVTGPIWAKPVWGVFWTWDHRLTSTLILWLMYVGYLVVRTLAPEKATGARWSAVVAIVGFLDVPIVHYSVRWWYTLHPPPKVFTKDKMNAGLEPEMAQALWIAVFAFAVLFAALFFLRLAVETLGDRAEEERGEAVA